MKSKEKKTYPENFLERPPRRKWYVVCRRPVFLNLCITTELLLK